MRIALATCRALPNLDLDDAPLVAALAARGAEVVVAAWDGGDAPFLAADLTVVRSTWDYTEHVDAFLAWVSRIEAAGRIENRASIIWWNSHKRYLKTLVDEGVQTVPTVFLSCGSSVDAKTLMRQVGSPQGMVLKPAISANARHTLWARPDETAAADALLTQLLPTMDVLVQPFVEGVLAGELSLHFFDGNYSHTIHKKPKAGDFRSQSDFGAALTQLVPDDVALALAHDALAVVGGRLLYARVDVLPAPSGGYWLSELELIEPSMSLSRDEQAAARFADAIVRRAAARR